MIHGGWSIFKNLWFFIQSQLKKTNLSMSFGFADEENRTKKPKLPEVYYGTSERNR